MIHFLHLFGLSRIRFLLAALLFVPFVMKAQSPAPDADTERSGGTLHGLVFGDYYYKAGADSLAGGTQYAGLEKNGNGFQIRRAYLYYDYTFDEHFSSQVLLEANDKSLDPGGRFGVFVKTAFVEWKGLIPRGSVVLGLIPTPTWGFVTEKVWNYRSVEKTIIDQRGLGNSSDLGFGIKGNIDPDGMFSYSAMVGNGTGQKPENNKNKKAYGAICARPLTDLVIEGYADYESAPDDRNRNTLRGFAAYQGGSFTIGAEVMRQVQQKAGVGGEDRVPFGISFFAHSSLPGLDNIRVFARFDRFDPDSKLSDAGYRETFFTAGVDIALRKNVRIMPNIWINAASAKNASLPDRDMDIVERVTFFYIFK